MLLLLLELLELQLLEVLELLEVLLLLLLELLLHRLLQVRWLLLRHPSLHWRLGR